MPELFDASANSALEIPANRRERSAVRGALEELAVGQGIKYTADEEIHIHRNSAQSQRFQASLVLRVLSWCSDTQHHGPSSLPFQVPLGGD